MSVDIFLKYFCTTSVITHASYYEKIKFSYTSITRFEIVLDVFWITQHKRRSTQETLYQNLFGWSVIDYPENPTRWSTWAQEEKKGIYLLRMFCLQVEYFQNTVSFWYYLGKFAFHKIIKDKIICRLIKCRLCFWWWPLFSSPNLSTE